MEQFNTSDEEAIYREAATKILGELTSRGFTSEYPESSLGLEEAIIKILLQTIRGNTIYCTSDNDGWEGDLQNQAQ